MGCSYSSTLIFGCKYKIEEIKSCDCNDNSYLQNYNKFCPECGKEKKRTYKLATFNSTYVGLVGIRDFFETIEETTGLNYFQPDYDKPDVFIGIEVSDVGEEDTKTIDRHKMLGLASDAIDKLTEHGLFNDTFNLYHIGR